MGTRFIELSIEVPAPVAEVLADAVGEITGGVEVRDDETIVRIARGRSVIVAQVAPDAEQEVRHAIETACARLRDAGMSPDPMSVARREADEDEWRDVWKKHFRAQRVGTSFLLRPSWDPVPAGPGDRVIDIDPGRAFGTGGHASTRLVIAISEEIAADRPRVARFLDLGCGSGILSIAAARLWPSARGLAIDVDPEAVATTDENLALNHIDAVETRVGSLGDVSAASDVVLANIEASVLVPLAREFPRRIAPGGTLVLSGLLTSDVDAVTRAYRDLGFEIEARRDEGEWAALRLAARRS